MTTEILGESEIGPHQTSRARRRILVAGAIGTAIEWYDFFGRLPSRLPAQHLPRNYLA